MTLRAIKPWKPKTPRLYSVKWLEYHLDDLTSKIVLFNERVCFNTGCIVTNPLYCGHLLERRHRHTRWDIHSEGNCHAQCEKHNFLHEGQFHLYQDSYIERFGERAFDDLVSRSRSMEKFTYEQLENMYQSHLEIWNRLRGKAA